MSDKPYVQGRDIQAVLNGAAVGRERPFGSNGHTPTAGAKTFQLLRDVEVENLPPARPILGDILYEDTLSVLYGPYGSWKSFVATAWGASLASGRDWLGRRVKQGPVIYVAAEGARGIGKRIHAWKRYHHARGSIPFYVLGEAVHFLNAEHIAGFISSIRTAMWGEQPVLIIIDTLARSMVGGHENDTKDAANVIAAADTVRMAFPGCCVLFIHHTGYDQSHMRGNTAFGGAADVIIQALATGGNSKLLPGDTLRLVSEKTKDEEGFKTLHVTTEVVIWQESAKDVGWQDGDGEAERLEADQAKVDADFSQMPVSSLVIVQQAAHPAFTQNVPESPPENEYHKSGVVAWRELNKLCIDTPQGVAYTDWERVAMNHGHMARTTFKDARRKLMAGGWVLCLQDRYHAGVPGAPDMETLGLRGLPYD